MLTDLYRAFWLWVMRFAYRRVVVVTQIPDGIPSLRDIGAPCPGFSPRKPRLNDWTDCETDGHYLCAECCHRKDVETPQASPGQARLDFPRC